MIVIVAVVAVVTAEHVIQVSVLKCVNQERFSDMRDCDKEVEKEKKRELRSRMKKR